MNLRELITSDYQRANSLLHLQKGGFGKSGSKYVGEVMQFAHELGAATILDYGCGEGTLRKALHKARVSQEVYEWDPAIPKRNRRMPLPADLVVCTDVLEHVEPDKLDNSLKHLYALTRMGCYLAIATRPANQLMPDGSNAHRTIEDGIWWTELVQNLPWTMLRSATKPGHEVRIWLRR